MASNQVGKINLNELLTKQIASLYMSEQHSDITLYVEKYKIPGHRSIIGARCEYLNNYFSKNNSKKSNQIKYTINVPLKPFQIILEYLYTGQMDLYRIENIEILIQILELLEKYCLFELKKYFENYFIEILLIENSCRLLEVAKIYELKELEIKCLNIIDTNPDQILKSESLKKIPQELLEEILTRKSFDVSLELSKYQAVIEWSKHENRNIETVIHLVNLPLIPLKELLKVRNLGTLTGEKIFDTIAKQYAKRPNFNENIATSELNARVIQGYNIGSQLLTSKNSTLKYDMKGGYIRQIMGESNDSSIVIELGNSYILNHFKMLLFDCDSRTYSYFIEISTDQKLWNRIIDYSKYNCRSWQNLYFPAKPIKYIKLSGTHCSQNKYFDVVKFEAFYLESIPEIKDGFVVPKNNVALVEMGASVIKGRCFPDRNGIISNINVSGSVWHEIGDNQSILIRLSQPFYINYITLWLDDFHTDIKYKFYIETSVDNTNWVEVVDQRNSFVTKWKSFRFPSKLVMFIKIVGTDMSNPDYVDLTLSFYEITKYILLNNIFFYKVPQLQLVKFKCSSEE